MLSCLTLSAKVSVVTGSARRPDDDAGRLGVLGRLGTWCAGHSWWVIGVWLVLLLGVTVGHQQLGGSYSDDFTVATSSAAQGSALLAAHEPAAGGQGGQLVFSVPTGSVTSHATAVEAAAAAVRALPHVLAVSDPLAGATISADRRAAYATVHFDTSPVGLGHAYVATVNTATAGARTAGVAVDYGGLLGQAARPKGGDARSERIGIAVAVLVLLLAFGSVYAAALPILSAVIGVVTGLGVLGMLASAVNFASVSPTLAVMMGLGVGIDYGLFLTTRHRQQVLDGADPIVAAGRTTAASGRAVVIAAVTVVIALLGLYASGLSFTGRLGVAGGVTVAVSAAAALTLVPALLGRAGRRIDRVTVRRPVAETAGSGDGWARYARSVGTHPWRYLLAGVAVLAVLAVPLLSMRLGHVDAGADPRSYTDKRAYDAIATNFGPGANGPLTVVAALPAADRTDAAATQVLASSLRSALAATTGVVSVSPVRTTTDGALLVTTVMPTTGPQAAGTDTLLRTLTDTTLPRVLDSAHATGYVTGATTGQLDFRDKVSGRLPDIIAVVIAAAFLLLLLTFRAPVLALKAGVLNLLSIGAAYGVLVAVFQWGWGSSLLGLSETVPVESYVPMIMFAIVFGLSMDYEVFLLSRIKEAWDRTHDNQRSVAAGLTHTGRVITCAALIMVSVFFAFLLSGSVPVKMLALGLSPDPPLVSWARTVSRACKCPSTCDDDLAEGSRGAERKGTC